MRKGKQIDTKDVFLRCLLDGSLFDKTRIRDALIAYVLFLTGAKPKELVALRRKSIDLDRRILKLEGVKFSFSLKAKKAFENIVRVDSEYIFCNSKGNQLTVRRIEQIIKKLALRFESSYETPRTFRTLFLERTLICEDVKKTRLKSISLRKTLSFDEEAKLRSALKQESVRNRLMLLILLETGIRIQELISLTNKHISSNQIIISKDISYNGFERRIQLSKKFSKESILFRKEQNISLRRFEQVCAEIGNKIGLELTPSLLRATAIKQLLKIKDEEEINLQVGLSSDFMYTHGFVKEVHQSSFVKTSQVKEKNESSIRKDNQEVFSSSAIYRRSRTRHKRGDKYE